MLYTVCAVFDKAAECFGRPFFAGSVGLAVRGFSDEVNRRSPDNPMSQHPADFVLYHLGSFNDAEGTFELFPRPERLQLGTNVLINPEK